ncbi:MAG TPA: S9 family peptidase [Dehalococcoidia bacterium]|nr:S9 family peptidase [Dehalococcoidia bacterium]
MPLTAPYGSWKSPISADLIVGGSIGIGQATVHGDDVFWLEVRPKEGGRSVIVRRGPDGSAVDLNPAPLNARTRVHEYGGGDYVVGPDATVYFANFTDQRVYRVPPGGEPEAVTHTEGMRYADAVVDERRNRLICVREDHSVEGREAVNTIAAIDLASGDETMLLGDHDFYSSPRLSPDGGSIAWLRWDHPNMPWDGCDLLAGRFDADGRVTSIEQVAGGKNEAVCQPEWSPDGALYFVSDPGGPSTGSGGAWWNLYRWRGSNVEALAPMAAEFGRPHWVFGQTTYDFDGPDRIIVTYCERGAWKLASIDTRAGALSPIETPFTAIGSMRVGNGRAVFTAGSPTRAGALVSMDLASGAIETLKTSSDVAVDEGYLSVPETLEFPTEAGLTAYGFFYPPRNKDYAAPEGEKPPLLVMSHGGPTAATSATFSLRTQYWTSRGVAVLDVNYGGSTGYGRAYRERLNGRWGVVDVDYCVNGAKYLVDRGLVDGDRIAITGGSAGGFTTLAVLTFRDAFKAGASHYGVADLGALARDTHKFESRYLDGLVGPYPERRDVYEERSPIAHVDKLDSPMIFFQGLEDMIVPPNQAEMMVEALRKKGVPVAYVAFEGEQHGFRKAENIKRSLEGELYFYSRVFGFALADAVAPVEIENLP